MFDSQKKNCIVIKFFLAVNATRVIRQLFEINMSLKRTKMTGVKFKLQVLSCQVTIMFTSFRIWLDLTRS